MIELKTISTDETFFTSQQANYSFILIFNLLHARLCGWVTVRINTLSKYRNIKINSEQKNHTTQ